jgi:outer membrane protein assembly factor BamB
MPDTFDYASPAVVDGVLYISAYINSGHGTRVYALNASTLEFLWNQTLQGQIGGLTSGSPAVANGRIFVATVGWLYALNATEGGKQVWNFSLPLCRGLSPPPTVSSDGTTVYVCSSEYVYALDSTTGNMKWNFTPDFPIERYFVCAPSVQGDNVIVSANNGTMGDAFAAVYDINAIDGIEKWSYKNVPYFAIGSPTIYKDKVYVGSDNGYVWAFDLSSGSLLWKIDGPCAGVMGLAAAYDTLYFTTAESRANPSVNSGWVYAIDLNWNGSLKWRYQTGQTWYIIPFIYCAPAVADGKVFVGAYGDSKIYAFSAFTGAVIWTYETWAQVGSTPALADGKAFVPSGNKIYRFSQAQEPIHDVAVTKIYCLKTVVCQNYSMNMSVTLENQGELPEFVTSVKAYANDTLIASNTSSPGIFLGIIGSGRVEIVVLRWNAVGFSRGRYLIKVNVTLELDPGQADYDPADNSLEYGYVSVAYPGDINADGKVDVKDVAAVSAAYNSQIASLEPSNPKYAQYWHTPACSTCPHNPNTDITNDGKVDAKDIAIVSKNYGWHEP